MNQYYLISQFPSLDGLNEASPLPISEERFYELCSRFLSKKAVKTLNALTLKPSIQKEKTGIGFVDSWNDSERLLRLALGKVRAEKMKKSFDTEDNAFSPELLQTVRVATELSDPLEAEQFLNSYRLSLLEALRPADTFSEDYVFYYGLKLKLISRIKNFDEEKGKAQYKKIYGSIINGKEQEE